MIIPTKLEVEEYVSQLEHQELQYIYKQVNSLVNSIADTLSNDFQIACEIENVFVKYTNRQRE
jgi:hypothetical protein